MKKISFSLFYFFLILTAKGQVQTASFNDGTKINYEIISNSPDVCPKFKVGVGVNGPNLYLDYMDAEPKGLGSAYVELAYNAKLFNTSVYYGKWGYGVDGVIFLSTFDKQKEQRLFLMQKVTGYRTKTLYTTKANYIIRKHLGVHLGYNHLNYTKINLEQDLYHPLVTFDGLKTNELFVGFAFLRKTNIKTVVVINGPKRTGAYSEFGLYSDVLLYTNTESNIDDLTDYIGLRLFINVNKEWYIRNTTVGYFYKLGVQYGPLVYNFFPIFNVGLRVGI